MYFCVVRGSKGKWKISKVALQVAKVLSIVYNMYNLEVYVPDRVLLVRIACCERNTER